MSPLIRCFPPIVHQNATVLILGSMPGAMSLATNQYYAHPRNAFWPIMSRLLGFAPEIDYRQRLQALQNAGIALWDVVQSCKRDGSLDASIITSSQIANDLISFLQRYSRIQHIFFNGGHACATFRKHVPSNQLLPGICLTRLPSTSPANAGMTFTRKLIAWQVILDVIDPAVRYPV